ncbi:Uncharacterised protein [Mycobacteroides abscessus subsp. abscessus]|nr:Uncharacterised protein [Mycobacteroides abscessus subsp. abscessus]
MNSTCRELPVAVGGAAPSTATVVLAEVTGIVAVSRNLVQCADNIHYVNYTDWAGSPRVGRLASAIRSLARQLASADQLLTRQSVATSASLGNESPTCAAERPSPSAVHVPSVVHASSRIHLPSAVHGRPRSAHPARIWHCMPLAPASSSISAPVYDAAP